MAVPKLAAPEVTEPDPQQIRRTIDLLFAHGGVAELRALGCPSSYRSYTAAGYYDDPDLLASAAEDLSRRGAKGVYMTFNTIDPSLLARSANRWQKAEKGALTSDSDVTRRLFLLIDTDPCRKSRISSTSTEHEAAIQRAEAIRDELSELGWPDPIFADSGNGGHLIYAIDLPVDDEQLVERFLKALSHEFSDDEVAVDTTTHNPARLTKIYGTVARKGDNVTERPHRVSRLIEVPDTIKTVPRDLIEAVAKTPEPLALVSGDSRPRSSFDLESFIKTHLPDAKGPDDWSGKGQRWEMEICPINPEHADGSSYIVQHISGAISAGCHHNSCQNWGWSDLRKKFDPEYEPRSENSGVRTVTATATATPISAQQADEWPEPAAGEAYHGVAGDVVRAMEPHTESDPIAILAQLLVAVGNIIERTAHFVIESDPHYLNLFAVIVGPTSKGRKGTSWGQTRSITKNVDAGWNSTRVVSGGLSSGEGLIFHVRDPVWELQTDKRTKEEHEVLVDPGVDDKRLLVVESEFANTLRVVQREGNNLSPVTRNAWDGLDLQTLTRNNPIKASSPHISILGHITADELRRYMDRTEAANGFANRFLWIAAKRSKYLPHGGQFDQVDKTDIIDRLRKAVEFGRNASRIELDPAARELWESVYGDLSDGKPGMYGAVTSRAEAQVRRLATLYAVLDQSNAVRFEHLAAAIAIWEYADRSARFIFGESLGDPAADEILAALKNAPSGLTRTQISALFNRNKSADAINRALATLLKAGLARPLPKTGSGSAETWVYVPTSGSPKS